MTRQERIRHIRIKKDESQGKINNRTIIHSESDKPFKINTHHVTLGQSVEETRLGKEKGEGGLDESERSGERPCGQVDGNSNLNPHFCLLLRERREPGEKWYDRTMMHSKSIKLSK